MSKQYEPKLFKVIEYYENDNDLETISIIDENGAKVAHNIPTHSLAYLMAASLDLLKAGKNLLSVFDNVYKSLVPGDPLYNLARQLPDTKEFQDLRRAIAKAEEK